MRLRGDDVLDVARLRGNDVLDVVRLRGDDVLDVARLRRNDVLDVVRSPQPVARLAVVARDVLEAVDGRSEEILLGLLRTCA